MCINNKYIYTSVCSWHGRNREHKEMCHGTAWRWHGTAQHITELAQHGTAKHGTAWHGAGTARLMERHHPRLPTRLSPPTHTLTHLHLLSFSLSLFLSLSCQTYQYICIPKINTHMHAYPQHQSIAFELQFLGQFISKCLSCLIACIGPLKR